jgi:uncharacterized BrkB/YihY/UPF0761 family membrane protein
LILTIISLLVLIIFGGSIYAFFYAIFLFIFSAGDPEKIKKAWNSIRFMILGIILTLSFLFIFPIIFKRMKLPGYEMYTASNVFSHASYLLRSLIGFGSEAIQEYQTDDNIDDGAADYEEPGPDPAPPQQLEL